MLKKTSRLLTGKTSGRFAIVASKYNDIYVDSMLRAARDVFVKAGSKDVHVTRVPGAFEIPVVAARLARLQRPRLSAIVCLGVILRGATVHAQSISDAVSRALMDIQVSTGVPVIHEVLLLENVQQAEERCLSAEHNRGMEAASTALEMAQIMAKLPRE